MIELLFWMLRYIIEWQEFEYCATGKESQIKQWAKENPEHTLHKWKSTQDTAHTANYWKNMP